MWLAIVKLLGSAGFSALVDAYKAKLEAGNTAENIAADLAGKDLELQGRERELNVQQNIADNGRWWTAAPRAIVCWSFAIFVLKVVVWDKVLSLGSTDPLSGDVQQWAGAVMVMWFGGRTLEKISASIIRAVRGR
jgi:hypothetical protein